tara:strand:+ start:127 stop:1410 length:1284 start_codon:yes stop_codon:yes gene_type:complete
MMTLIFKHIFFLLLFTSLYSCKSVISLEIFEKGSESINEDTEDDVSEPITNNYTFKTPSIFLITSGTETVQFEMQHLDGEKNLNLDTLTINSSSDTSCELNIEDSLTDNPKATLSNCSGNGRLWLSYNDNKSYEIYIKNNSAPLFVGTFDIRVTNDNKYAFVVDNSRDTLYKVDIATGIKTIIFSPTIGTGESISSMNGIHLNESENRAYITDNSKDALVVIDLETSVSSVVSNSSKGSGTNFSNITCVVVDKNEDYAYVADRSVDRIFKIDISTGNRTLLTPSIDIIYGMDLSSDQDSLYFVERSLKKVNVINLSTEIMNTISENQLGDTNLYNTPHGLAVDPLDSNFVYVMNQGGSDTLFKVDITTGEKSLISSKDKGIGPELISTLGMTISDDGKFAFVVDTGSSAEAVLRIDLSTGDRTYISK